MKIKLDFVTNSSSTAYLVCLPKNYDITDVHDLLDGTLEYEDDLGEYANEKDDFFEAFSTNIKALKDGGHIWNHDDPCFWSTYKYLEKKGCIISSVDTSGDGMDLIQGIDFDKLKLKMKKIEEKDES